MGTVIELVTEPTIKLVLVSYISAMLMLSSAQGFIEFLIEQNLASSILQLKLCVCCAFMESRNKNIFAWTKSGQVE